MTTKVIQIGAFESLFSQNSDVFLPEKLSRYEESLLSYFNTLRQHEGVTTLSFDVFDTLLLRNTKYELHRFYEVCERSQRMISTELNVNLDVDEIFAARILAFKTCYRSVQAKCQIREGQFISILILMLKLLSLSTSQIELILPKLIEVEVNYEIENLSVHPVIENLWRTGRLAQFDIIFISDMYLPVTIIRRLVDHFYSDLRLKGSYSSADIGITKSSGLLYDFVLEDLNLRREEVLHMGDNLKSDVQMAKKRGIKALHLAIPDDKLAMQNLEKRKFKVWLSERGFDLSLFW